MNITAQVPPVAGERWVKQVRRNAVFCLSALVIGLAGLAAYHNSFHGPFVFDDEQSILENPTIRHLWPVWMLFSTPAGTGYTITGRPLVNFTLALNYALGGTNVSGYHAFNLLIHLLAGLTLFGVVRRTLLCPSLRNRFEASSWLLAFIIALLWTLHPLQTESVTYVVQRAETLAAFLLLLTLYAFIRGVASSPARGWFLLAPVACVLGMAAKETMAVAPLLVLLYDRTFAAGSFRAAFAARWRLYAALAGSWLLMGWLMVQTGSRGGTAGLGTNIGPAAYALTQCRAILHYLRLALWPQPLVFDYGTAVVGRLAEVWPQLLAMAALLSATAVALRRMPAAGFLGAWFFLTLAPSSSFVPVATQTMAEHRMYLPLAAVVALWVLGIHMLMGRRSMILFGFLAVAFGWVTVHRNRDYRSELALWGDTVEKCPGNARAHSNYGKALFKAGWIPLGLAQYQEGVRLDPSSALIRFNLANALAREGRLAEAVESYEAAVRLRPEFASAHFHLAEVLEKLGRLAESADHYEAAVRIDPDLVDARNNLGNALLALGRIAEAISQYQATLLLEPHSSRLQYNLGNALAEADRLAEAAQAYGAALQERPDYPEAHANLANVLFQLGLTGEAVAHYEAALRLAPDAADIHANFGTALLRLNRTGKAREQFEAALRIDPQNEQARDGMRRLTVTFPAPAIDR